MTNIYTTPFTAKCTTCKGVGYLDAHQWQRDGYNRTFQVVEICTLCGGTGERQTVLINQAAIAKLAAEPFCGPCRGTGYVSDGDGLDPGSKKCAVCNGTGGRTEENRKVLGEFYFEHRKVHNGR